ncbi:MAG: hypothetical protein HRF43_06650, partial [Phycisphaerae bacterium]
PTQSATTTPAIGPVPSGYLYAVDPEGGDTRDYRAYQDGTELLGVGGGFLVGNHNAALPPFSNMFPVPKAEFVGGPGNGPPAGSGPGWGWVRVEIRQQGGTLTWRLNEAKASGLDELTGSTSGSVMLGHMDLFESINVAQTYTVFDNVIVFAP